MENLLSLLHYSILDNQVGDLLWFVGILLLGILIKRGLSFTISRAVYRFIKSEAGTIPVAEFIRLTRKPFEFLITLMILLLAFSQLTVPEDWAATGNEKWLLIVEKTFFSVFSAAIAWLGIRVIKFIALIFQQRAALTETTLDDQLVPFLKDIAIVFWTMTCFLAMLNKVYDVNVWALVTSLGIGGLVIALAARETIENLIASVAIMLERPFVVGDTVVLGTISGDIEQIGFRSTRIRSLDGGLVSIPNRLMTSQALENMTQRTHRRAKYYVRIAFDTPIGVLNSIIEQIQLFLENNPSTNSKEPTVKLEILGESSFDVLIVYHVNSAAWKEFIRVREEINFKIIEIVQSNGASFAYPGRNLFIRESVEKDIESFQ
ncbi:MAG: mechanosensitive ion channel family protein [Spirosomataceae bacterium]